MNWKGRRVIVFCLFCTYLVMSCFIPSIETTNTNYNAPYRSGTGPTIDGSIIAAEWNGSTSYEITFNFNDTANPIITVKLYLLHNGSALFIGLNMTTGDNQSDSTDAFYIYFDEEHNDQLAGNGTLPREEGLKLTRAGVFTDLSYNGSEWIDDESIENLTKGPSNGARNGLGEWEFIVVSSYNPVTRKSQNTSDFDVDLPSMVLEGAVTIGFDIEYYDADINQYDSFTTTANRSESTAVVEWDNLVFGKVPYPTPNFSAIWAYIVIGMLVPAVVIVLAMISVVKRKVE
ncbi:MAG TPA: hypothetical protein VMV49_14070 [Candidatus Deferrimicrobium sp.]|nr:hypothetical protein [Candidatus Deferrimicrobium sp.]